MKKNKEDEEESGPAPGTAHRAGPDAPAGFVAAPAKKQRLDDCLRTSPVFGNLVDRIGLHCFENQLANS
eukprot:1475589-Pyramimonas_sp.AAC.1